MMPLKNSQRITPNNLISGHLNGFKPYHHWEVLQKSTVTRSKSLAGSVSNGSQSALPVPLFFFFWWRAMSTEASKMEAYLDGLAV